jgi:hypothetical protein
MLKQQDPFEFFRNFINTITESGNEIFDKAFNIQCEKIYTCNKCQITIRVEIMRPTSLNLMPDQYKNKKINVNVKMCKNRMWVTTAPTSNPLYLHDKSIKGHCLY